MASFYLEMLLHYFSVNLRILDVVKTTLKVKKKIQWHCVNQHKGRIFIEQTS